jgi:hypothetical protein
MELSLLPASAGFFLGLLSDPEDGGNKLLCSLQAEQAGQAVMLPTRNW